MKGAKAPISESNCHMPTDHLVFVMLRRFFVALTGAATIACTTTPAPTPDAAKAPDPATAMPAQTAVAVATPAEALQAPTPAPAPRPLSFRSTDDMLRYMAELGTLTSAGLSAELAALGDPGNDVDKQLRVALTLINHRRSADTAKALGLLQKVEASSDAIVEPLKPLVRVLEARLMEQRRLEDQADRQAQVVREYQRKIEALNRRLEAMRAIERSLSPNPMTPSATPRSPGS